jgi:cellulose 1,4-beta-cellobiosidase
LQNASVPHHFIIDQGRSGLQNTRTDWGDWCNVKAGFGQRPTTDTGNEIVDSLVWVKPAGESDGACGPLIDGEAAPAAGLWWDKYAQQTVEFANPPLPPTYF